MTLLHEMGMLLKVLEFVVFQNKHATFAKQVIVEDELHQGILMLAVVRRVGKDEVVLHLVVTQETVHI